MNREEVRARIEEIGIIPAVRVASTEDALFAAESVASGGIPIVELTMTVPGAIDVISHLVRSAPQLIVGAGTVWDTETARRCLDAGARFLTSTGLDLKTVEFAHQRERRHFSRRPDANRSDDGVESRCGLRQGISMRTARRRRVHQERSSRRFHKCR